MVLNVIHDIIKSKTVKIVLFNKQLPPVKNDIMFNQPDPFSKISEKRFTFGIKIPNKAPFVKTDNGIYIYNNKPSEARKL